MSIFNTLETLSQNTTYNQQEYIKIYLMECIVERINQSAYKDLFVLRGGMLSRFWYDAGKWMPSDIDFMVATPLHPDEMEEIWTEMMQIQLHDEITIEADKIISDIIWATAKEPGLRLWIPIHIPTETEVQLIQIDISYGDPTVPTANFQDYPSIISNKIINTKMVYKETSAGWKLYGLFERSQDRWRAKDLFGLYWLLTHFELDKKLILLSFKATCIQRGTPFAMAARLFEDKFGKSRESQRRWKNFCKEKASFNLDTNIENVLKVIRQELTPYYIELLKNTPNTTALGKNGFPIIRHIDDVVYAIQDRDEFRIYHRDNYAIIDYLNPSKYTFMAGSQAIHPSVEAIYALRKECRGLIFDKNGHLIARKLHKFFRIGERDDTTFENIDWSKPCRVLEKLDGSLVVPVNWNGNIHWTTRKGRSVIAEQAATFAQQYDHNINDKTKGYQAFIKHHIQTGYTATFEWCSREHPIVLDYSKSQLVLTAIRHNETGDYIPYPQQQILAQQYEIPCVKQIRILQNKTESKDFIDTVKNELKGEGYILRFDDDRFYKVKNDRYFILHNLVAHHHREIFIWKAALSNETMDLIQDVAPSLRPPVIHFTNQIHEQIDHICNWAKQFVKKAITNIKTNDATERNKLFATQYVSTLDKNHQKLIFSLWHHYLQNQSTKDFRVIIQKFILDYCSTRRRLEKIRPFLGNIRFIDPNLAHKKQQFSQNG